MIPWESCVLWLGYPLQNGVWPDVSKHNNDGIITGAWWDGDALSFDGVDDMVVCGSDPTLNITGSITLEVMVKAAIGDTNYVIIKGNVADNKRMYGIQIPGTITKTYYFYYANTEKTVNWDVRLDDNKWHHVVVTVSGVIAILYDNGISQGNRNLTDAFEGDVNTELNIGCRNPANHSLDGEICLVRIFNTALTADQVRESYEQSYRLI